MNNAHHWISTWKRAWPEHDAETIAALYADDAVFLSHPFREPERPIDYLRRTFSGEGALLACEFRSPIVDGDRASVEYRATIRTDSGVEVLAGVTLLRFNDLGLVTEHRDYWAVGGE